MPRRRVTERCSELSPGNIVVGVQPQPGNFLPALTVAALAPVDAAAVQVTAALAGFKTLEL